VLQDQRTEVQQMDMNASKRRSVARNSELVSSLNGFEEVS